jgi:hypothetical protein
VAGSYEYGDEPSGSGARGGVVLVAMLMIHLRAKSHMPNPNGSLVMAVKLKPP